MDAWQIIAASLSNQQATQLAVTQMVRDQVEMCHVKM